MSGTPPFRRLYVTDCEGPLSRNDNAQELAEHFIPQGAGLFAQLSRYDDVLADIARRPGYNAGDTLRLLPPFLIAYGATDARVLEFSSRTVFMVPHARDLLAALPGLLDPYIISTSYTPYVQALCEITGFPFERCHCTTLSLDAWRLDDREASLLRTWAERILRRPLIEIPPEASSLADLDPVARATVAELDALFWEQMSGTVSGEMLAAVRPIGGGMKLAALEDIVAAAGRAGTDVLYVGDSITDAPTLAAVRGWGGIAVSFNGNGYALAAAEVAVAATDALPMLELARAFAAGGPAAVRAKVHDWPPGSPVRVGLLESDRECLTAASLAARTAVRGEHIARLG
jgi:predicted HAD superfamily phosphohydrolase